MRRTPLRKASKKRAKQLRVYQSLKAHVLAKRPYCEMPSRTGLPSCLNRATQIHHMKGRAGNFLTDVTFWLAVCQDCHRYIHDHAREARQKGLLKF